MIYTHIKYPITLPSVGHRWTNSMCTIQTEGGPLMDHQWQILQLFCANKLQNNCFWKVIHLKQMNLSQDSLFSRSVKTSAVQPMVHQLSIALTDHSYMCQIKKFWDSFRVHKNTTLYHMEKMKIFFCNCH